MIVDDAGEPLRSVAVAAPQCGNQQPVRIDQGDRVEIVGNQVDGPMNSRLQAALRRGRRTSHGARARFEWPELEQIIFGGTFRRAAGQQRLNRAPHLEKICNELPIDRADARAPIGLHHQGPLAMELAQGLADRHVADAVAGGEFVDGDPRAKGELAQTISSRIRC